MKIRKKKIGSLRLASRLMLLWVIMLFGFTIVMFCPSCVMLQKKSPEKFLEDGKYYYNKNNYKKAYKNYTKAIEGNRSLFIAYWDRALVEIKMDSLERAIDDISIYIESNPEGKLREKAYVRRAEIMIKRGYRREACDDWEVVCGMNLDNAPFACEQLRLKCK